MGNAASLLGHSQHNHDDWSKMIGSSVVIISLLFSFIYSRRHQLLCIYSWKTTAYTENATTDDDDVQKNIESRRKAKEAAENRQKLWKSKQTMRKFAAVKLIDAPEVKRSSSTPFNSQSVEINGAAANSGYDMSMDEVIALSRPVFDDGLILFRNMFQLSHANQTATILQRLAHEFIPIIRQREYNVTSVSEFCCCGDGMDYQMGGQSLSVRPGQRIAGHESENVMGYNRVVLLPNNYNNRFDKNKYVSTIHLRLRSPLNHNYIIPYDTICENFCHELAHCVHHDHSPEFYKLMRDIQEQYKTLYR